jgi:hypothetical protein
MKRLRLWRGLSILRPSRGRYVAGAAVLMLLVAAFVVPAASAGNHTLAGHRDANDIPPGAKEPDGDESLGANAVTVSLRRGALESCNGAVGGTPVPNSTASISATTFPAEVTATVNLAGRANTFYTIQLVTSASGACQTLGFQFVTTNGMGRATTVVAAARGSSNSAFVTATGGGDFQVSNLASFSTS